MIVVNRDGEVQLVSRRGARFVAFPEITEASAQILPPDTVVDGELIIWRDHRTDFAALHTRVAAGPQHATELSRRLPAHGALFDALIAGGRDIRSRSLAYRRLILEQLMADAPQAFPLTCWLQTSDLETALTWMNELAPAGIEGLIAKPAYSPY